MTLTKAIKVALILSLIRPGVEVIAAPQQKSTDAEIVAQLKSAQVQKLLGDTLIDTKDLQEEMPLAKFLVALEAKFPERNKISLRIDAGAFGKRLPQVAGAKVKLPLMKNVHLAKVLRRALAQVSKVEQVDYAIRSTGIVITQPRLAAHSMDYEVQDIVQHMPSLLPDLQRIFGEFDRRIKSSDGLALLVRTLMNEVGLQPWETIEVLNATRMGVFVSPTRHEEVINLLACLRRLADVAVVMNARLYEVDRAFFTKHVAPLFSQDKDAEEQPLALPINGPLFKIIAQKKYLLQSENSKIRPHELAHFLSQQIVFRYAAGPHPTKEGLTLTGTGLAGVTFEVRPRISPDRRYLRLQITQQVAQLVGIDKVKTMDISTGKEGWVESPNLRKSSVTGTVQFADGTPILMPVDYRPSGKGNEDKVWLLVARPFIWIDEEVKEIRKGGGDVSPQTVWDSEVPKEEKPAPEATLPLNDEVKEVLQGVITDVLTNPDLKSTRDFYGTAKDKTFTLVDNEKKSWPREFYPETKGYTLVKVNNDPFANSRRVLGIRLDKFDLKQKKVDFFNAPIEVCLFNAGGSANGAVIGGCTVYYVPKRIATRWTVEYVRIFDP
jgi:hypothetical protein